MKNFIKLILRESLLNEKTRDENLVFSDLYQHKYKGFYSNFNEDELVSIINFLQAVIARTNSGLGVGISKEDLNKLFFKTPESFRKLYEQKPSPNLWRGDSDYPCTEYYDESDNYLQSFSNKSTASFFGDVVWVSTTIMSYDGSFSTTKFNKTIKNSDYWFLKASHFYIKLKNDRDYSKLFTLEEFYPIYYTLMGNGIIGRKYNIWLLKYLKSKGIDFYNDKKYYDDDIDVADDEGEVMFFNVKYNCNKLKSNQ